MAHTPTPWYPEQTLGGDWAIVGNAAPGEARELVIPQVAGADPEANAIFLCIAVNAAARSLRPFGAE